MKKKLTFEPVIKGKEEIESTEAERRYIAGEISRIYQDEEVYSMLEEEEQALSQMEYRKNEALSSYGILNDLSIDDSPKKLIYSDGDIYAFVYDRTDSGNDCPMGYGLWQKPADEYESDDWCEVSDLTMVAVFTYQKLKEIAIAIGWIRNSNDDWLI